MASSQFIPEGGNSTAFSQDDKGLDLINTINGANQRSARTWQVIALVSLASFAVSLGLVLYALSLPKTVPVIVTVAPDGEAAYAGKVDKSNYGNTSIPEIARTYQIKKFLHRSHTWVSDPEAQRTYVIEAQAIVQSGAINALDRFFRSDNPFNHTGEKTRSIDIEPPLKQTDKTYTVYFTTTEKSMTGFELAKRRWSALVNLDLFEPSPANPLGLYITNFDIKRLEEK